MSTPFPRPNAGERRTSFMGYGGVADDGGLNTHGSPSRGGSCPSNFFPGPVDASLEDAHAAQGSVEGPAMTGLAPEVHPHAPEFEQVTWHDGQPDRPKVAVCHGFINTQVWTTEVRPSVGALEALVGTMNH